MLAEESEYNLLEKKVEIEQSGRRSVLIERCSETIIYVLFLLFKLAY